LSRFCTLRGTKGRGGGEGSGKSHFFAELLVERCLLAKTDWVCIREVQKDLKDSAKKLIEGKIESLGVGRYFDCQKSVIKTPYGGEIIFMGMKDHTAESVKSLEGFDGSWVEEAQSLSERSLELLRNTIRKKGSELWFSWNPTREKDAVERLLRGVNRPANSVVVRANWHDNPWFPEELEGERVQCKSDMPIRYGHIWDGEYEPAAEGGMWDQLMIDFAQKSGEGLRREMIGRIVVGVDPAGSGKDSDEVGIVAVAELNVKTDDGEEVYCVMGDYSIGKQSPRDWALRVGKVVDGLNADCVVYESNFGGDLVKSNLASNGVRCRLKGVHASRGKHVRAEPIAALYDAGRVWHYKPCPLLEAQLLYMTPQGYAVKGSPDRADALVWALTELSGKVAQPAKSSAQRGFNNG